MKKEQNKEKKSLNFLITLIYRAKQKKGRAESLNDNVRSVPKMENQQKQYLVRPLWADTLGEKSVTLPYIRVLMELYAPI